MNGKEFEEAALLYLQKVEGVTKSSLKEDVYKGTDLFYYGVPIDLTINLGKDNLMDDSICKVDGFNAWSALRLGNKQVVFDTPVIVLGFSSLNTDVALIQLQERAMELLETISDTYWLLIDQREESAIC